MSNPSLSVRRCGQRVACQLQVLPYQREDLGGIVGIREAEGHPSLFAKGLQGGLLRWFERGIGYCASRGSLRDADPFVATGLPANFSNWVAWLFEPLFLFVSLLSCKPEYAYKQKKASAKLKPRNLSCPLRRERDSNPRNSCPFTAFRVRPDRPLRHLSNCECKYRDNFFIRANFRSIFFRFSVFRPL